MLNKTQAALPLVVLATSLLPLIQSVGPRGLEISHPLM
jgi:hypothetical protein